MYSLLSCPHCSEEIIKSVGETVKMRAKVTVFRDGGCFAVCRGCSTEVAVPMTLDTAPLQKSMSKPVSNNVRLYIDPEYITKKA